MHKIVVLIPFRNVKNFIVDSVNSVLNQKYSNYEIYLLDDYSDDGTLDEIDAEIDNLYKIRNEKRVGPMENIYRALTTLPICDEDIVVLLDGDDYLIGEYVFQMLNQKYNKENIYITYGQYITSFGEIWHCPPYTREDFNNIRKASWKGSHLKTFKYKLFKKFLAIDPEVKSFKFDDGSFFMATSDQGIMIPLLEIAGYEGSFCFSNILYCYREHSNNDHATEAGIKLQLSAERCIRSRPPIVQPKIYPGKETIQLEYSFEKLDISVYDCFQSRGTSTVEMFKDALKLKLPEKYKNFNYIIHAGDFPKCDLKRNNFYYCCQSKAELSHVIPDFSFHSWQEAGISSYGETVNEIQLNANEKIIYDKLLWIGNVNTHSSRTALMQLAKQHPNRLEIIHTEIDEYILGNKPIPYISLADHCKYKYLLDVEGRGYSSRLKFLLFTRRLVFIQDRKWKEYYHFDLKPYEHFIPVRNDLSDLILKIEEAERYPELYEKITLNALSFAKANLEYEKVIKYMSDILWPNNSVM